MRLRHILFNRVKSDTGFVVKIRTMDGYAEYREGNHVAIVPVDRSVGQYGSQINKNAVIKWNPPYSSDEITEEKRNQILQNVIEAMRFRKYTVELV